MYRRTNLTVLFSIAFIIIAGVVSASAQFGTITGTVKLKQADGTTVPVENATVEAYRTDTNSGKLQKATTNSAGQFTINNARTGQTYALSISAPGANPGILPNVQAGMGDIPVELSPGDGKAWTEQEVRDTVTRSANMTEEDIERQKQLIAENEAARKRAEDNHKLVNAALKAGDAAYKAKDYQTAITKFDEGIAVDPDFVGSAPVLLNYKGVAYKDLGYASYLESTKTTDAAAKAAALGQAKAHWAKAIEAFNRGLKMLNEELNPSGSAPVNITGTGRAAASPDEIASYKTTQLQTLTNAVEVYRLTILTKADEGRAEESTPVFEQYLELEPDAAKRTKVRETFAKIMLGAGDIDRAVNAYRQAMADQKDNPDIVFGLGISLIGKAYTTGEKSDFQEAANYLKKFLDMAPKDHKDRDDAQATLDAIKADPGVSPKKI